MLGKLQTRPLLLATSAPPILLFMFFISSLLLSCKDLLKLFTEAQIWEELVLLRNCLSQPWRLSFSEHCSWWLQLHHTAWDEASRPHSFEFENWHTQIVHNFSFQDIECHSSTCAMLHSTTPPVRCTFPYRGKKSTWAFLIGTVNMKVKASLQPEHFLIPLTDNTGLPAYSC